MVEENTKERLFQVLSKNEWVNWAISHTLHTYMWPKWKMILSNDFKYRGIQFGLNVGQMVWRLNYKQHPKRSITIPFSRWHVYYISYIVCSFMWTNNNRNNESRNFRYCVQFNSIGILLSFLFPNGLFELLITNEKLKYANVVRNILIDCIV